MISNAPRQPTVNKKPVDELHALISPAAFMVSPSNGTHEITRCYFVKGKYEVSYASDRLGSHTVLAADFNSATGLAITVSGGYVVLIPKDRVQLTYRTASESAPAL